MSRAYDLVNTRIQMIISRQGGKRAVMPLQPIFWNLGNGLVSLNQGVQNLLPLFSKDKPLLKA